MTQSDPRGPLPPRPTTPPAPPPVSSGARPPEPPAVRWHRIEITSTTPDGELRRYAAEGDDAWAAASVRAYADQIDPPRPATRAGARPPAPGETPGSMVHRGRPGMVALPPPSDVPGRPDPMSTQ